jgi:N-acetylmuramoyl-L-alanine amidase/ribosomal protein L24E
VVLVASGLTLAGRPTVGTAGASAAAASAGPTSRFVVRGLAPTPDGRGYWLVASDGGVFAFGDAGFYGSTGSLVLKRPIVGMAATPDGHGYWLVASDGGVFAFGDAGFYGSTGNLLLNRPIVGMAATPDGHGYWLVAADGGIFAFGDAGFYGSTGSLVLNRPVVGMAPDPDGHGYWLVAADGGIFAFGDAPFLGSTGSLILNRPIVGMDLDRADGGYRLVAADGGVFTFRASFAGSAVGQLRRPAVGTASHGAGYWVVTQGGSVSAFGGAGLYGSVSVLPLAGLTVAIDPGHDGGNGAAAGFISRPIDGGNFTEPCDTVGTETATGYPEHAFNFDVAVRLEALLQAQGAVVVMTRSDDAGVGPCVDTRAAIGNASGAAAAISIHADGGPVSGRGFDVIEPAPVVSPISDNTAIVGPSAQLAADVRNQFAAVTGEQVSDYSGTGGIDQRNNLGGLNLSTVPKVLIECANMQNPTDAALTESAGWRQQAAQGLADGLATYLEAQQVP